jgi:alpha-D-ribose 1-methylphosphonate 5-triphosphate synthase subunit PhnL
VLHLNRLSKHFNVHILDGKIIQGCEGISFELNPGEFLGISGPSGIGKSTILKCIYRTYLPSSGEIWYNSLFNGKVNLATLPDHEVINLRQKEIGYISQFLKVIPRVSALEIVTEPLIFRNGSSPAQAKQRAAALLERLNIPAKLYDAYPATFSGGEQQRVNIARAIIWKPRLLLLDEPTASLDKGSSRMVVELLKELSEQGTSMIGVIHQQELLEMVADRVYTLTAKSEHHGP